MQIIDLKHPKKEFPLMPCGLVLGNFDGVHRGHQALIDELKRKNAAREERLMLGAFCFAEPPSQLLGHPVPQLVTGAEKLELLREQGLHFAVLCDFAKVKDLSPMDFVKDVLIGALHCKLAVCGFNYSFGKKGAGKAQDLQNWLGTQPGCEVSVVDAVTDGRHTVSSTVIRSMLERGHPEDATRLLGRPFSISGVVTKGKQLGGAIGFPTANIPFPAGSLVPAHGVYAVTVRVGKKTFYGISNVGSRPTFDDGESVNCETYLFDFHGDLYGKNIRVSFLHFLRAERAFGSAEDLRAQIERDVTRALEYF